MLSTCSFTPKLDAFEMDLLGHEAESTREPALASGMWLCLPCLFRQKCNAHLPKATRNLPPTAAVKVHVIGLGGQRDTLRRLSKPCSHGTPSRPLTSSSQCLKRTILITTRVVFAWQPTKSIIALTHLMSARRCILSDISSYTDPPRRLYHNLYPSTRAASQHAASISDQQLRCAHAVLLPCSSQTAYLLAKHIVNVFRLLSCPIRHFTFKASTCAYSRKYMIAIVLKSSVAQVHIRSFEQAQHLI
ncbi:hypothetical protein M3J09_001783 [Ascochyta lentis]